MNLGLEGKVIIVTGGSKGIGEAIVIGIANEGGIPVIVNRPGKEGELLTEKLKEEGKNSLYLEAELSSETVCESIITKTFEKFGRIDGLVNNAGKNDGVGLKNGSSSEFMTSIQNNLLHYFNLAHFAVPYLIKSKGSIVNISSKTAVTGQGGTSAYIACKGAQLALTREWAVDLINDGVRVNAILPAEVWTPLYKNWIESLPNPVEALADITRLIPLGQRMTTSEEIADAALFLLSERAAHITGQHWFVDGGYTHLDRSLGSIKK